MADLKDSVLRSEDGSDISEASTIPPLQLDLIELRRQVSAALHVNCTDAKKLCNGTYHEIFILDLEHQHSPTDGENFPSSCIARCPRSAEPIEHTQSVIATMNYVKTHSDLPVPRILFSDLSENNPVGAPYVLMEQLPGKPLGKLWFHLSTEHKKGVIRQIARVVSKLATLKFDQVGALQPNGIGPLYPMYWNGKSRGPFSTAAEYLSSFTDETQVDNSELKDLYRQTSDIIKAASSSALLQPPFRLIHADFDAQNLLFIQSDGAQEPKLSGILDWDHAHTGPLYYLFDYPIFIQDVDYYPELYDENKTMRQEFVGALQKHSLDGGHSKEEARRCLQEKTYLLNGFYDLFVSSERSIEDQISCAGTYLDRLVDGTGMAYNGRCDYEPDEFENDE
ncbi:hypothetical protein LTR09_008017 [Extremus antarcticus]|uniref:Aminoglycoside phosphotransferase domain-containing protein n=1 Tax=Extremus antarcticus TaxID=702011 RepID=A0AAJ0GAU0_9PEZI|nr:hypothetical protein LTR09_008017 [Extremus antarcticus]